MASAMVESADPSADPRLTCRCAILFHSSSLGAANRARPWCTRPSNESSTMSSSEFALSSASKDTPPARCDSSRSSVCTTSRRDERPRRSRISATRCERSPKRSRTTFRASRLFGDRVDIVRPPLRRRRPPAAERARRRRKGGRATEEEKSRKVGKPKGKRLWRAQKEGVQSPAPESQDSKIPRWEDYFSLSSDLLARP